MSHLVATWQTEPLVWFVDCELGGCGNPPKKILQDERLQQVLSGFSFGKPASSRVIPSTSLKTLPGRGVYKETRQNIEGKGFTGQSLEKKGLVVW